VSQEIFPPNCPPKNTLNFIFQRLKIFKLYFTRIFCIQIYTKLYTFIQLFFNLLKLCHIMHAMHTQPENFPLSQCIYHKTKILIFHNKQTLKCTNCLDITVTTSNLSKAHETRKAYSISSSVVIVSKIAYHLDSAHRDHNTHRP